MTPVISTKGGVAALEAAIAKGSLSADAAKLMLRILAGAGVGDAALTGRLQQIAGLPAARPEYDPAFVKEFAEEAMRSGDPARGQTKDAIDLFDTVANTTIALPQRIRGPRCSESKRREP